MKINVSIWKSISIVCALIGTMCSASAQVYNTNLIDNGGADAGSLTGWTQVTGGMEAVSYGASGGFPTVTDPGPADRGVAFFAGGNNAFSEISQTLDLTSYNSAISTGTLSFTFSAYLGGFGPQGDNASFTLDFKDASNANLTSVVLLGPDAAERGDATGLLHISYTSNVPLLATSATFLLDATRTAGTYNDGYADSLSFVLAQPASTGPSSSPVPEPSTYGLLGCAALGLLVAKRRFVRR